MAFSDELAVELQKYEMIRRAFSGMHPLLQVIFFFSMVLTGMALAMGLGIYMLSTIAGESWDATMNAASQPASEWGKVVNLVLNSTNQILAFGLAALGYHWLFGGTARTAFSPLPNAPARPFFGWFLSAAVAALAMSPLLDVTYRLNRMIVEWTPWGEWVAQYEAAAEVVTRALLTMPDLSSFIWTVITVALLPAVFEEIAFRGVLMPRLAKSTGNIHAAVWISAALFSAIHLQFFGFVPRMLIGAGLGYLTIHSGRLWPAMVGHFVNNGSAVMAAYIIGPDWFDTGMDPMSPWSSEDYAFAAGSFVVLIAAFIWWRKRPQGLTLQAARYLKAIS
ncbi:MAG: lysostaphin resistance A-like protein [Flavobacteriales bacterium]